MTATIDWAAQIVREAEIEADEIMSDYADTPVEALADELERTLDAYDGGPELGRVVVGILRRHASGSRSGRS